MPVSIQGLAVKLTANIGGFASGMASAAQPVMSLGSSVAGTALKVTGLLSAITGLVGAGSLTMLVHQSMEAIDANAKLSDRLGLSTEGLVGLQHAAGLAGVSNEALTGAMEKMLKSLSGAADDGELTSSVFKKLGLDAAALANMPADQAFSTIAQKLSEIKNPAERATAAMQIFGKSGQQLLPLMMSGADGIKAAQEEAVKLGLAYSRVDAAKVEAANDSMTRMGSIVTGVGNQVAIGLSPFIDAAAAKLTEMATEGGGIGPKVGGAIEWVAKALAYAADYTNLLPAAFHGFRAGALQAIAGVLKGVDMLGGGLVKLLNLLPGVSLEWTDTFANLTTGLEQEAASEAQKFNDAMGAFHRGDTSIKVAKVFDDIRAKSQASAEGVAKNAQEMNGAFRHIEDGADNLKKVTETLTSLQKDVAQFGLSDSQRKLADFTALTVTPEQLAQAKQLLALKDQLTAVTTIDTGDPLTDFAAKMEKLQQLYAQGKVTVDQFQALRDTAKQTMTSKLEDSAKSVIESVKSPLEIYNAELVKLQGLLDQKLITQDVFNKAKLKAQVTRDSAKSQEDIAPQGPQALRANTAEAMKLAFDNSRGIQSTLGKNEIAKKQLDTQEDMAVSLKTIAGNTKVSTLMLTETDL